MFLIIVFKNINLSTIVIVNCFQNNIQYKLKHFSFHIKPKVV